VVKGNAYGLDTALYVEQMVKLGARHFAAADICDAVFIKNYCPSCEVLLMTPVNTDEHAKLVVENGIVATVENAYGAVLVAKYAATPYPIHVKIDVGFGRYGVKPDNVKELEEVCKTDGISIDGVFTHLPKCADKKTKETQEAIEKFFACVDIIKAFGAKPKIIHALSSVGIFRFLDERFTAVRVGSAMVGRMPPIVQKTSLANVAVLECDISSLKKIRMGECIGYSSLFKAKKDIDTAVVNIGHADGFGMAKAPNYCRRIDVCRYIKHDIEHLFNKPRITAKIKGKTVTAVGTIGMTACSFDVTGMDVSMSDIATIEINPIHINSNIPREYKTV
jgi:alanine racemase